MEHTEKETGYAVVNRQVVQLKRPEGADSNWRIARFLRRRELMKLPATTGMVRPNELGKRRY